MDDQTSSAIVKAEKTVLLDPSNSGNSGNSNRSCCEKTCLNAFLCLMLVSGLFSLAHYLLGQCAAQSVLDLKEGSFPLPAGDSAFVFKDSSGKLSNELCKFGIPSADSVRKVRCDDLGILFCEADGLDPNEPFNFTVYKKTKNGLLGNKSSKIQPNCTAQLFWTGGDCIVKPGNCDKNEAYEFAIWSI